MMSITVAIERSNILGVYLITHIMPHSNQWQINILKTEQLLDMKQLWCQYIGDITFYKHSFLKLLFKFVMSKTK